MQTMAGEHGVMRQWRVYLFLKMQTMAEGQDAMWREWALLYLKMHGEQTTAHVELFAYLWEFMFQRMQVQMLVLPLVLSRQRLDTDN